MTTRPLDFISGEQNGATNAAARSDKNKEVDELEAWYEGVSDGPSVFDNPIYIERVIPRANWIQSAPKHGDHGFRLEI